MKKKLNIITVLIIILAVFSLEVQAQWFRLGLSGEYNQGRVFFNPNPPQQSHNLYGAGGLLQYENLNIDLTVESGLIYKKKGWIEPDNSLNRLPANELVVFDYIEIPLKFYWVLIKSKKIDFYTNTGGFIGYSFRNTITIDPNPSQNLSYGWETHVGLIIKPKKIGIFQIKAGGIFHFSNFIDKSLPNAPSLSRYIAASAQITYYAPFQFSFTSTEIDRRRSVRDGL